MNDCGFTMIDGLKARITDMIIETAIKPEEDLDLLCNSLNAQAGRFKYSDPALRNYLLRAQAAINSLCEMLESKERTCKGIKSGAGNFADMPTMQSAT